MSLNFLISKIAVTFPPTSNCFSPLVYKYNSQYQITNGIACGTPNPPLDNPIRIYENGVTPPSGNSFVTITTATGQYQLFFTDGVESGTFSIAIQLLTSPDPYPYNCSLLVEGLTASQDFILNIDTTSSNTSTGGISLTPAS